VAKVKGRGKRRHGKPQLRIDESRRWLRVALQLADEGEEGAVAAMMTLLMNMRCSEIVNRIARDVDDEGRVLWISAPSRRCEPAQRLRRKVSTSIPIWSSQRPTCRRDTPRARATSRMPPPFY
jgi:hypothetical protein